MMGLFGKKETVDKKASAWIIHNQGDPGFVFAECYECGYEIDGEQYKTEPVCPRCKREILTTFLAEEIK